MRDEKELEAMRFNGQNYSEIRTWSDQKVKPMEPFRSRNNFLICWTPNGMIRASAGDWIVKADNGEFYPIREELFRTLVRSVDGLPYS